MLTKMHGQNHIK